METSFSDAILVMHLLKDHSIDLSFPQANGLLYFDSNHTDYYWDWTIIGSVELEAHFDLHS